MNIDLGRARILRNVDYVMGAIWFCLGVYLAYVGYPTIACFYMCMGPFMAYAAWMRYSFLEILKLGNKIINDLEAQNGRLLNMIEGLNPPGYDDYDGGYVE